MKKLLIGLSLVTLLVGCASRDNGNGMGGTADDSMKTDTYNTGSSSSDQQQQQQLNNDATDTTGTPGAPAVNNGVGTP